jgi:hypothetical protein
MKAAKQIRKKKQFQLTLTFQYFSFE